MFGHNAVFTLKVSGSELQTHFNKQSKYHIDRVEYYKQKENKLRELAKNEEDNTDSSLLNFANSSNYKNDASTARAKVERHIKSADMFKFLSSHVAVTDTYTLCLDDMYELELVKSTNI